MKRIILALAMLALIGGTAMAAEKPTRGVALKVELKREARKPKTVVPPVSTKPELFPVFTKTECKGSRCEPVQEAVVAKEEPSVRTDLIVGGVALLACTAIAIKRNNS